jgi:hypothetical protein
MCESDTASQPVTAITRQTGYLNPALLKDNLLKTPWFTHVPISTASDCPQPPHKHLMSASTYHS